MSWNDNNGGDDSGDEMFQMSSMRIQEDGACVRLLSSSDDESPQQRAQDAHLPDLHFRRTSSAAFPRREQERKFKLALISVLVLGIAMIIIISVGLGVKLRNTPVERPVTVPKCPSQEKNEKEGYMPCGASFPWQKYRLPTHVLPSHYHVYLHPNLTETTYAGQIHIIVTVSNTTDTIILHSKDLKLQKVAVHRGIVLDAGGDRKDLIAQKEEFLKCAKYDFVAIQCSEKLLPGQIYTIFMEFNGNLSSSLSGFYLSKYTTKLGENKTLATTQFESTYAREAFPCFDEPAYKANFTLSIVRDSQHSAISNMPMKETKDIAQELKLDVFETSIKMSTYLVAFIVSDLGNVSRVIDMKAGQLKVSLFASRDKLGKADFALDVACKVIKFYENLFTVAYPLPKLDLVAVPDFEAGAMENWGLVTYRETLILFDENTSSLSDKERVAIVIAHELAHQWFGNLVTMRWWNDLWLNEGFASYMEYIGTDGILPQWKIMETFGIDSVQGAMATDRSKFTHPISVPVESFIQIEEVFDDISYAKGACIISMVVGYLGKDAFFSGIGDYLRLHAYGNANNSDLIAAVTNKVADAKGQNIEEMMNSWTTQPGFPILTVSKHGDQLTVSQDRYLLPVPEQVDHCKPPVQESVWQIPLSYITSSSPTKSSWQFLSSKKTAFSVPGNPAWIKFNFDRLGYFVVHYQGELLDQLSVQLKKDHTIFSPSDRAGIIYDLGQAARAGYLDYSKVFDILKYAVNEDEYQPLLTVYSLLRDIEVKFRMQFDQHSHESLKSFVKSLLSPQYKRLGWPGKGEGQDKLTHLQKKMRMLVVSVMCNFNDPECLDEAQQRYLNWKANKTAIPADYQIVVYSVGIELGGSTEWDHLWKIFSSDDSKDEQQRKKLLKALCRTKDERKVTFLLEESLKGEHIRSQDTAVVLISLTSSKVGSFMVWKFLREKWNEFIAVHSVGSFTVRQTVISVLGKFTDDSEVAAAWTFFKSSNVTDIRYVKRAMDTARINVHWVSSYQPHIIRWLHESDATTAR